MTIPAPSFEDLYEIGLVELLIRRPDLAVLEGDVTDAMLCGIAAAADAAVRQAVAEVRRTFLDGASGTDLVRLIDDHLKLPKIEESQSVGTLTIQRTGGGAAETFLVGHRVGSVPDATGQQVVVATTAPLTFLLGENGPKTVAAEATLPGRLGNAAIGALNQFVDRPTDVLFTVTNVDAFTGGGPEEDDDTYRQRARDFYGTLRRATLKALEFGARQVPQVRIATAVESVDGIVTVYVADADGNSNLEMIALVDAELEVWRAAGVDVQVVGSQVLIVNVDYSLVVADGVDMTQLEPLAAESVDGRLAKFGAGRRLYLEEIRFGVKAIDPDGIFNVVVNTPAADVVPLAFQIIRAGTVTRS